MAGLVVCSRCGDLMPQAEAERHEECCSAAVEGEEWEAQA